MDTRLSSNSSPRQSACQIRNCPTEGRRSINEEVISKALESTVKDLATTELSILIKQSLEDILRK